ncbi:hypothetical protein GQ651_14455 [Alphaproteobacteria bacterium GH1-50]|uniref:Uncharacterized protein n=1 Tax=Kangsaoukella pontilimi TaxID=2691042 RepID=A0A7C9ISX2_9RHOB|nr:hypothetical protein [Kangsaoukella pontilimi]
MDDPGGVLTEARARAILEKLGLPEGRFRLSAEMPPGGGAGASTAALVALARAAGDTGDGLARACLGVEGASDPLMLKAPDRVLWAPRRAEVIAPVAPPPPAVIVGGFWGAPSRTQAQDIDFPDIADLVADWARARSLADVAAIASASAVRTTAHRGPEGDPTPDLARALGAFGHLRAHTGSARGLIFAPGHVPEGVEAALAEAGVTGVLTFATGGGCV